MWSQVLLDRMKKRNINQKTFMYRCGQPGDFGFVAKLFHRVPVRDFERTLPSQVPQPLVEPHQKRQQFESGRTQQFGDVRPEQKQHKQHSAGHLPRSEETSTPRHEC